MWHALSLEDIADISVPSSKMFPFFKSEDATRLDIRVVLPQPLGPTIVVIMPVGISRERLSIISSLLYAIDTFLKLSIDSSTSFFLEKQIQEEWSSYK